MKHIIVIAWLTLTASAAMSQTPVSDGSYSGKVIETMNAANYTYVLLDTGAAKLWAAAPQLEVKVGDSVAIENATPMPKFHSKTLNRDFEVVYFTSNVKVNGKAPAAGAASAELPKGHPPIGGRGAKPPVDFSGIKKAEDGRSIADIYASAAELNDKPVKVRGKVVRYNPQIMGKNWLHIQDGTGSADSNDLTVTTSSTAKIGDTVLVSGTVSANRDFGSGYKYRLIIEDAKVTVE
jgi:FtsP/CotA-like multicopper oxidase with cupredoxin domain